MLDVPERFANDCDDRRFVDRKFSCREMLIFIGNLASHAAGHVGRAKSTPYSGLRDPVTRIRQEGTAIRLRNSGS